MKRVIILSFLLANFSLAYSQITITGADMPVTGKVSLAAYDTVSNPNIGAPSVSPQVWDFSTLNINFFKVASYSPIAPYHPYASGFPNSNMFTYGPAWMYAGLYGGAPVNPLQWGYLYWRSDTAGFKVCGFRVNYGVGDTNILESPEEVLMFTPATYNDSTSNSSRWIVSFNKVPFDPDTNYISTVNKTLKCDAFGNMTTSFGTYDVIRVHESLIIVDSLTATLGSITYWSTEIRRDTVNNYHYWTNGVGYPLVIVRADKYNNVLYTEWLFSQQSSYTIMGTVYKSDSVTPVTSGQVHLYAKSLIDHLFGIPEVVPIDNNGHFQFASVVNGGNFLVHAIPDTNLYPFNIPTYYGDAIYWPDAATLSPVSDTAISIATRSDSLQYLISGLGEISGTIFQDLDGAKTIEYGGGIKVTLEQNPSGVCYRHTYTNSLGQYRFTDVPQDDFRIRVDIAAVTMDSTYYIYYSGGDTITPNLDFVYDSVFIYIYDPSGVGEGISPAKIDVEIYPNPFTDQATLVVNSDVDSELTISIYELSGKLVKSLCGRTGEGIKIDREGLVRGIYILDIQDASGHLASGKIVIN